MYKVYLIRNLKNGKGYVGITKQSLRSRLKQHGYKSSGCVFINNAIKKHGKDSFCIGEIVRVSSKKEAEKLEIEYIKQLKTSYTENGYNLMSGGMYFDGHSELTKLKMSKSHTGVKRPPMSDEQKLKISQTRIRRKIKVCPKHLAKLHEARRGKKFSKQFCEQISNRQKGSNNPVAKAVVCNTGETFGSIVEAAKWCKGNKYGIANNVRGLTKSSGKHPVTKEKLTWKEITKLS